MIGSRCGSFLPAIELLSTGKVNVEPLIQKRFPID
jgi:threonine dehydrogenase-like Zn-dependent dehydrogenase